MVVNFYLANLEKNLNNNFARPTFDLKTNLTIQSTSENGTFGLSNRTKFCLVKNCSVHPKRLITEQNRFGTGFVFDKPNDFVRLSEVSEIGTV